MAQDILIILMSTFTFENVFHMWDQVVDQFFTSLIPKIV